MKATVDAAACVDCGLCADTCPEVFVMDGGVAKVKVDAVPAGAEGSCKEAAANCPVQCISVA